MSALLVCIFEGHELRLLGTAENPEWIAIDVAKVLEIRNFQQIVTKFEDYEKGIVPIHGPDGEQSVLTLTEPGLYRLIFKSRKAIAKRFKRWIFQEVIPAIRKRCIDSVSPSNRLNASFPSAREKLETISFGLDLLEDLGGWDAKTELLLRDKVKNILLAQELQPSLKLKNHSLRPRLEYPVSDRVLELGYHPTNRQLQHIGKKAKKLYQQRHGSKAIKKQLVAGTSRKVNVYQFEDLDLLDEAIAIVMDK